MEKKITVIIPVYNMEKYLEECLESIVNQTIDGLEVIAVNDGSTDNSLKILNKYSEKYSNIIVYSQENQGQASAKNYGILHAKGKYIIFMDPDDYYPDNDCLERLYDCAEKQKALICAGIILSNQNGIIMTVEQELIERYFHNQFVNTRDYEDIYGHTRYLFNTELIVRNNILFPLYRRYEDQPFTVRALALAGKFYASDIVMYMYRVGHKSVNYSLPLCIDILKGIRDTIKICRQYNLDKMYERCLKNMSSLQVVPFYRYSYRGSKQIDNIIEEIESILSEWKEAKHQPLTRSSICNLRKENLEYHSLILRILRSRHPVILYGAGKRADDFLHIFSQELQNVIGFAVSNALDEKLHQGIKMRNPKQYNTEELRKNAYVLVTTSEAYWKDIADTLEEIGFENIVYMEMPRLWWADTLLNDR